MNVGQKMKGCAPHKNGIHNTVVVGEYFAHSMYTPTARIHGKDKIEVE